MRLIGRRLFAMSLLSAGVAAAKPSAPPVDLIEVARADIAWTDASARTTFTQVTVDALLGGTLNARYLLVDTAGPIATLTLDRATKTRAACLSQGTFRVGGAIHHVPRDPAHVVVVGPLDASAAKPRLMFVGLARAGRPASEAAEPLGVAPPPGGEPLYAVDLDGDRVADLVHRRQEQHGAFDKGIAPVRHSLEAWQRAASWTRTRLCEWTTVDTLR
jgi:hypothetical protein